MQGESFLHRQIAEQSLYNKVVIHANGVELSINGREFGNVHRWWAVDFYHTKLIPESTGSDKANHAAKQMAGQTEKG